MKKIFLCTLGAVLCATATIQAQNNVGVNTATPDASAALEVQSTTQGMLVPRMTKAQRDVINMVGGASKPATGLLIYQTDDNPGFYFYSGSAWASLSGGSTAIADDSIVLAKLKTTGTPSQFSYLRGDGTWSNVDPLNATVYAAKKNTGLELKSFGLFPVGFRAVNFLASERSIGSAALFVDPDHTYVIPSMGIYQIGYTFRYGNGLLNVDLTDVGVGILRTRNGVGALLDSRLFTKVSIAGEPITISEASINRLFSFQAGDKINFGLVGSNGLNPTWVSSSVAEFFIYKVSQ